MRARTAWLTALSVAAAGVGATAAPAAAPTKSQSLFADKLVKDAKTASGVKRVLRSGAGFVDAGTMFADLTGDGKADAVVVVRVPGAAGAIAVYLFSTDGAKSGSSALRAVFRTQQLYRATVILRGTTLVIRTPKYADGDDICCAAVATERDYAWSATALTLTRRDEREIQLQTTQAQR
jgi:hypothetical protein